MNSPDVVTRWSSWGPNLLSVLRIVAAIMFMLAGSTKLFAFPAGMPPNGGTVKLLSQLGIGAVTEVFGGGLMPGAGSELARGSEPIDRGVLAFQGERAHEMPPAEIEIVKQEIEGTKF